MTKLPSLSTLERINDTRNTYREVLVFKYLKTIERPKPQNLYSLSLYNTNTYTRLQKKKQTNKKTTFALVIYYERFQLPKQLLQPI